MIEPFPSPSRPRWRTSSVALIFAAWAILQLGGLFTPGLLDDVDSVYIQIAREMLQRHDFVTPTIDGIRFFDKPPLMYWMAAGSMRVFGVHDWAARLPLALGVLVLLFAVYALGNRLFAGIGPPTHPDRAGLYAALAMATSLGPYLYTRFYIPDILVALWMTLSVHLFLIALDRIRENAVILSEGARGTLRTPQSKGLGAARTTKTVRAFATQSTLLPMLGFAAVLALSVLTKGLIGIVFPVLFVLLYLAITRNLRALAKLHLIASTAFFLLIAAPWHILAALRNPAIPMPAGVGLPARAGWAWFYLYNEHIARFLGRRIPHDYGQVPIPLFWLLLLLWLLPWVAWVPAAIVEAIRELRAPNDSNLRFDSDADFSHEAITTELDVSTPCARLIPGGPFMRSPSAHEWGAQFPAHFPDRRREAALTLLLWPAIILGFFTLSSRQEYYHLPALPALALLAAGLLAAADAELSAAAHQISTPNLRPVLPLRIDAARQAQLGSLYFLVPLGALLFLVCGYFAVAAPHPSPGLTLNDALSSNPALYNLSLGHVFDLTAQAMGFFRGPLLAVALCMFVLGPISHLVRRGAANPKTSAANGKYARTFAANLLVAAAMAGVLLAAHEGLVRFYPILGSKDLALAIRQHPALDRNSVPLLIDGELTSGSSLLFYTNNSVFLVNGRVNGPWFGSFWPDAPHIFLNDEQMDAMWHNRAPALFMTYHPDRRIPQLCKFGPVVRLASSGGKTLLENGAPPDTTTPPQPGPIDLCH